VPCDTLLRQCITLLYNRAVFILLVKAKFHYTSWFGASSELASVMEFGFYEIKSSIFVWQIFHGFAEIVTS